MMTQLATVDRVRLGWGCKSISYLPRLTMESRKSFFWARCTMRSSTEPWEKGKVEEREKERGNERKRLRE